MQRTEGRQDIWVKRQLGSALLPPIAGSCLPVEVCVSPSPPQSFQSACRSSNAPSLCRRRSSVCPPSHGFAPPTPLACKFAEAEPASWPLCTPVPSLLPSPEQLLQASLLGTLALVSSCPMEAPWVVAPCKSLSTWGSEWRWKSGWMAPWPRAVATPRVRLFF